MVDALSLTGRVDEAGAIVERVAGRANLLGLFSEEIDSSSGEFVGDFPQAYSHIGIMESHLNLALVEGLAVPSGSRPPRHPPAILAQPS